jgi:hypothetical protein
VESRPAVPSWSPEVGTALKAAGWPRDLKNRERLEEWKADLLEFHKTSLPEKVSRALLEFGGVTVRFDGPGVEFARGGFEIDPSLALGEEERFAAHSRQIGSPIFPLGEALDGNVFLGMDESGRVFLVADRITPLGDDIYSALDALLLGRRLDQA